MNSVSCLSPYINWGQISVNELWYQCQDLLKTNKQNADILHFLSELGWREFSYNLLYHFPQININNFQKKFDNFPWSNNENLIKKWQKGETGYPIVDAGMKELRTTGYMHNRVRMIVGSFLVKNLLVDWIMEKNGFGIIFLMQIWQITVLDGNGLVELVQMLHHISEYLIQLLREKSLIQKESILDIFYQC